MIQQVFQGFDSCVQEILGVDGYGPTCLGVLSATMFLILQTVLYRLRRPRSTEAAVRVSREQQRAIDIEFAADGFGPFAKRIYTLLCGITEKEPCGNGRCWSYNAKEHYLTLVNMSLHPDKLPTYLYLPRSGNSSLIIVSNTVYCLEEGLLTKKENKLLGEFALLKLSIIAKAQAEEDRSKKLKDVSDVVGGV